ncbi:isocitrate/isopropylmalate family dehydrogenase [Pseudogemmatithrix spongiicola]|uniref:Isocitrate/isopropylmalate family dehydrogenase n=1 Tax=Pseudogemmatithrix spongiicola TaxID=3062599 RepID=A0AA49Q5N5_9BACT|nr:isocitrate/isopropylmalate family dehydrogenase [Gemmatimonadaceae bacterium 'strain 138']WKW15893.1 isocitrate/isopropylmalate family dehydrogenase [Gemmatimonadaceae bacterium 'strain 318']
MSKKLDVTLIPGDGIGPAITDATVRVLEAAGASFTWDRQLAGMAAVKEHGDPIPEATLESIKRTKLALKGPLETPVGKGFRSINVALRKEFDLYANLRPAKTILPKSRFENVDVVLVRENTEGLYVGVENYVKIGSDPHAVAQSVAIISRVGAERIVRYAFEYALKHGRKKVTIVHKANILKYSQGLFLEVGRQVAKEYEGRVASDDKIVDACAMELVMRPDKYDVIVTTNLFGDILSDLTSGLVGGLGLTPGANIGYDCGIFEAVHGTAPDIAGQGIANPTAVMLAGCQLLDHVGDDARANRIRAAIESVLREGKTVTRDVGGSATTEQYTDAVIARLARG